MERPSQGDKSADHAFKSRGPHAVPSLPRSSLGRTRTPPSSAPARRAGPRRSTVLPFFSAFRIARAPRWPTTSRRRRSANRHFQSVSLFQFHQHVYRFLNRSVDWDKKRVLFRGGVRLGPFLFTVVCVAFKFSISYAFYIHPSCLFLVFLFFPVVFFLRWSSILIYLIIFFHQCCFHNFSVLLFHN